MSAPTEKRALMHLSALSFALVLLMVLTTPFVDMSGEVTREQRIYRILVYGVIAVAQVILAVLRGGRQSLRLFLTATTPFLVWAFLSLFWTQHVDLTAKRLALFTIVFSAIFSGFHDLDRHHSLYILRAILLFALLSNFAAVIFFPELGTRFMQGATLWRGVMGHKNIAGMLCAFTVILFSFDASKASLPGRLIIIAGSLIFLAFSWSKTAMIALIAALAIGGSISLISGNYAPAVDATRKAIRVLSGGLFVLAIIALLLLTAQRDFLLSLTDNTSAFTDRGAIWRPMIQFYLDNPILGSGYGAYWDTSERLVAAGIRNKGLWKNVDQGHNGYLDILVQVGLPGLSLALFAVIAWPFAQLTALIGQKPQRAAMIAAILIFSIIENFSESSLFEDDTLGNAILLIALAQLHCSRLRAANRLSAPRVQRSRSGPSRQLPPEDWRVGEQV